MFATQVLVEDLTESIVNESEDEEIVGLIDVLDKRYEIRKGETKIGRDPTTCPIVVENSAVSKVHAVIESDGIDDTFIYDFNSTNQTKLGKKVLKPHCRYKLEHESKITIGNITLKFLLPHKVSSQTEEKATLGNCISPNELEDIFDVPTQACVPQPNHGVLQLKDVPENHQVFKIPELVVPQMKTEGSLKSGGDSSKITKCQLDPESSVPRTECCNDSVNTSCIFSLSTQCQIIEPASGEDKQDHVGGGEGRRSDEGEKMKSLLNDGQDDILCSFMSLHSPSGQAPEIKTEIVGPDLSQVFNAETQVQAVVDPTGTEIVENALHGNKESDNQKSEQQNITNIPVGSEISNSDRNNDPEEDFIQTQEFKINQEANVGRSDVIQDSDTECYYENTIDFSTPTENTQNEDSICTQKFDLREETRKEPVIEEQENEELNDTGEDFMATQLFDVEQTKQMKGTVEASSKRVSFVVLESQEKDDAEESAGLTQRNTDEDEITTQVFQRPASVENDNRGNPERDKDDDDSDEDLIATQPMDFLVNQNVKNKSQEPNTKIRSPSRESSPNLLDSEFCDRSADDFISTETFEDPHPSSETTPLEKDSISVIKETSEDFDLLPRGLPDQAESSGDETESDLEIIFPRNTSDKKSEELSNRTFAVETRKSESSANAPEERDGDSHSSYVFQLEPEPEETGRENTSQRGGDSDSDATDCEEVVVVGRKIKEEPPEEVVFEDTQVLTLTPPNCSAQVSPKDVTSEEKEKFEYENECWSQLSLAMPNTQDMENTVNKIIRREGDAVARGEDGGKDAEYRTPAKVQKTEVGVEFFENGQNESRQVDSPLKRPGNSNGEVEAVPSKKSKTELTERRLRSSEKQFSRLWQVHDIEQIQPSRTRNSMRNAAEKKPPDTSLGDGSNEVPTSRRKTSGRKKSNRKLSYDITSYLTKKVDKKRSSVDKKKEETTAKENRVGSPERVLRSSRRSSGSTPLASSRRSSTNSRPRRRSRGKSEDYFGSSCVNVVFTGFDCESLEKIISELGGKKTSDLSLGDVVVADKVRRTVKFLSAVGLSLPITSPQYLMSCRAEKRFLNPWDFILKDEESEDKWDFELKASLKRSAKEKLMLGLNVYATKNAKPPVKDLLAIVECCGGTPLFDPPKTWPRNTVIVSCLEDESHWPLGRLRNIKVVHYEFILSGVLTQRLDYKTYRLR